MSIVSGSSDVNTEDDGRLNSEGGASPYNGRERPVNSAVVVNTVSDSSYVNTEDDRRLNSGGGASPDNGRGRPVNSVVVVNTVSGSSYVRITGVCTMTVENARTVVVEGV